MEIIWILHLKKNLLSIKYIGKKANNDLVKYNLKGIKKSFDSPVS